MEIAVRVVRISGPLAVALMGAAVRLWPPAAPAVAGWALAFAVVGGITFIALLVEEGIGWRNRRRREREDAERERENAERWRSIGTSLKTLEDHAAQSDMPALVREVAGLKDIVMPKLRIAMPSEGQRVTFRQRVEGSVSPADTPVQVLVFAGDNLWHPQQATTVHRTSWSMTAQFGDAASRSRRGEYKLVALAGPRIATPVADLPDGMPRSDVVKVVREAER